MTVLVIQHEDDDPIGILGERFDELGIAMDVRGAHRDAEVPDRVDPAEHCGVIVLGGSMGADDDAQHAWLPTTKSLLRTTIGQDTVPVLGICLGHQLIGSALGGRVGRNPAGRALGLVPVSLTAEGRSDPLLAGTDGRPALQWNDDVVLDLPAGASVLARTADGQPQAVRYGHRAWGVQFHPEVTAGTFAAWSDVPPAAADAAYAAEEALRHAWAGLADRFAALAHPWTPPTAT